MLEDQLETLEGDIIAAEETVAQSRTREKDTRDAAQAARLKAKSLETEVATLIKLLKPAEAGRFKPIVDQIFVPPGFEIALGRSAGRRSRRDRRSGRANPLDLDQRHGGRPGPAGRR